MSEALVSVIIPSYNRAYCICATVDSALAQTHKNMEIVVVDDGSTDDTAAVMAARYGAEPRVRYLHQKNQGVSTARNFGLRSARGDYLALLDSDDVWLPWKIEAQVQCLEKIPTAGMVWTDMTAVNPEGEIVHPRYLTKMYSAYGWFDRDHLFERSFRFSEIAPALAAELDDPLVFTGDIFSEMVLGNLVHTSTVLLTRERFERVRSFNVALRRSGEDHDFHLRTCREGPVAYLDKQSILYQLGRADQLTVVPAYKIDMARNFLATIGPVIERDRDRIRLPQIMIEEVLAEAHAWIGECHYDLKENRQAVSCFRRSLLHKPAQPRVAALLALSLLPPRVSAGVHDALRFVKRRVVGAS
jgi:glycosyltransferase involved in cell wall biosynthesis